MSRVSVFVVGIALGAALMFVAMRFHVVRADDGLHLVPRVSADLSYPYADVRGYGVAEWNQRRELALAIVRADKGELLGQAAADDVRRALEGVIESLRPPR